MVRLTKTYCVWICSVKLIKKSAPRPLSSFAEMKW